MKISGRFKTLNGLIQVRCVVVVLFSFFSAINLTHQTAQAAVYKKIDADGHVTFSDVPDKSFKLINVAPLSTVPALSQDKIAAVLKEPDPSKSQMAVSYSIDITSPTSDQSYHRLVDTFSPNVAVKPDLKNGDELVFLIDGKPYEKGQPLDLLERGQHQFEAQVMSEKGRVLKSKSVTFFVLQPQVRR